jgi:hypothetical protein
MATPALLHQTVGLVNNALERISEDHDGWLKVLPQHLPGETMENYSRLVRIVSVPAEISTEHLPDTSLEHYCYTSRLGHCPVKKTGS